MAYTKVSLFNYIERVLSIYTRHTFKIMFQASVFVALISSVFSQSFAIEFKAPTCNGYYANPQTSQYIDLVNALYESRILKHEDLKFIYDTLLLGGYENPLDINKIRNRKDFPELIGISKEFDYLLTKKRKKLIKTSILHFLKYKLKKSLNQKNESFFKRSFIIDNNLKDYYEPEFVTINPGRVIQRNHLVNIDYKFQVLNTPVSQGLFYKVLGYNPSIGLNEDNSVLKDGVRLIMNAPVNGVKKVDIYNFFRNLNEIANENRLLIEELMPGHRPGMKYRPLASAEWQLLINESSGDDDILYAPVQVRLDGKSPISAESIFFNSVKLYRNQPIYGLAGQYQEVSSDQSVVIRDRQKTMDQFWDAFYSKFYYKSNFYYTRFMVMYKSYFSENGIIHPSTQQSLFVDPSRIDLNGAVTFRIVRYYPRKIEAPLKKSWKKRIQRFIGIK